MAKKMPKKGGGKPQGTKKNTAPRKPFVRRTEEETPRRVRNPFENLARQREDDGRDEFRREDGEDTTIPSRRSADGEKRGVKRALKAAPKTAAKSAPKRADARKTPGRAAPKKVVAKTPEKPAFRPKNTRKPKAAKDPKDPAVYGDRLQKVLATAGLGSRRDCEEYILAGRIMVDREVVDELGARVLPHQSIHFDGELLRRATKRFYFALNKPTNVICTNDDPAGRRRALDFIHENAPGLFPVGRLDLYSEGLLLITNDGELANRLTHPRYEVPKVYQVRVSGVPTREEIAQISRGVYLSEGLAKAEEVKVIHEYKDGTAMLRITLREGRNREIRRILARVGHNVLNLQRVAIGPLKLGKMLPGEYRALTRDEVNALRRLVGLKDEKK